MDPQEIKKSTLESVSNIQSPNFDPASGMPSYVPGGVRDSTLKQLNQYFPNAQKNAPAAKPGIVGTMKAGVESIGRGALEVGSQVLEKISGAILEPVKQLGRETIGEVESTLNKPGLLPETPFFNSVHEILNTGTRVASGNIIKPEWQAPEGIQRTIGDVLGTIGGFGGALGGLKSGIMAIATKPVAIESFVKEYPLISSYLSGIGAFTAYGQLNPELGTDLGARLKQAAIDVPSGAVFEALPLIKGLGPKIKGLNIPVGSLASFTGAGGLGYGLAKLNGDSDRDALVWGTAFGILDLVSPHNGIGRPGMTKEISESLLSRSARDTLRKNGIDIGEKYTDKDLEAYRTQWFKNLRRSDPELYRKFAMGDEAAGRKIKSINSAIEMLKTIPESKRVDPVVAQQREQSTIMEELTRLFGKKAPGPIAEAKEGGVRPTETPISGLIEPPGGFSKGTDLVPVGSTMKVDGELYLIPTGADLAGRQQSDVERIINERINELQTKIDSGVSEGTKANLKLRVTVLSNMLERVDPKPRQIVTDMKQIPADGYLRDEYDRINTSIRENPPQTPEQLRAVTNFSYTIPNLRDEIREVSGRFDPALFSDTLRNSNPKLYRAMQTGTNARVAREEIAMEVAEAEEINAPAPASVQETAPITEAKSEEVMVPKKEITPELQPLAERAKKTPTAKRFAKEVRAEEAEPVQDKELQKYGFGSLEEFHRFATKASKPEIKGQLKLDLENSEITEKRDQEDFVVYAKKNASISEELTTKVLNRMEAELKTATVSARYIIDQANRPDVKGPEREIIMDVLKEFPDGQVNVQDFIEKVKTNLLPLALIESKTYAGYGIENVGESELGINDIKTHIYNSPFIHGYKGHFGGDFPEVKLDLEVKQIPDTNKWAVVRKDVELTEENIRSGRYVVDVQSTKEAAEQSLQRLSGEQGYKETKVGLFAHARVWRTGTKTDRIEKSESDLKTAEVDLQKAIKDKESRETFLKRLRSNDNDIFDKILQSMLKRNTSLQPGRNVPYADAAFDRYLAKDDAVIEGEIGRERLDVYFKSTPEPINEDQSNVEILREETIADFERQIGTWEIDNANDRIDIAKKTIELLKNDVLVGPSIRYVSEVQSDPFQGEHLKTKRTDAARELSVANSQKEIVESQVKSILDSINGMSVGDDMPYELGRDILSLPESLGDNLFSSIVDTKGEQYKLAVDFKGAKKILKTPIERADIRIENAKRNLAALEKNIPKDEALFMTYKNRWHERIVKEEIHDAALSGDAIVRFPTPFTVAKIEGFIGEEGNEMPYTVIGKETVHPEDIDDLKRGDKIEYGGNTMLVIDTYEGSITVIPEGEVHIFNADELEENREELEENGMSIEDAYLSPYPKTDPRYDDLAYIVDFGSSTEDFRQPDRYEVLDTEESFDIDTLGGSEQTVVRFYEKQLLPFVKKIRPENWEMVTDENGNGWLETKITDADRAGVEAYKITREVKAALFGGSIEKIIAAAKEEQKLNPPKLRTILSYREIPFGTKENVKTLIEKVNEQAAKLPEGSYDVNDIKIIEDIIRNVPRESLGGLDVEILNAFALPTEYGEQYKRLEGRYENGLLSLLVKKGLSPAVFAHEYAHHYFDRFLNQNEKDVVFQAYQEAIKNEDLMAMFFGEGLKPDARATVAYYTDMALRAGMPVESFMRNEFFARAFEAYVDKKTRAKIDEEVKGTAFEKFWKTLNEIFHRVVQAIARTFDIVSKNTDTVVNARLEKIFKKMYEPTFERRGGEVVPGRARRQRKLTGINRMQRSGKGLFMKTDIERIRDLERTRETIARTGGDTTAIDRRIEAMSKAEGIPAEARPVEERQEMAPERPVVGEKVATGQKPIKTKVPIPQRISESIPQWKDKPMLLLNRETLDRNIDEVAGEAAPYVKAFLNDPIKLNETARTSFITSLRNDISSEVVDNMGIRAGSKDDQLIQRFGEKRITLAELKAETKNWENVQKASKIFRDYYDTLLQMVNTQRQKFGYEPIPERSDYFRHFQEIGFAIKEFGMILNSEAIPTDISGLTGIFKPGKPFSSAELQRKNGPFTESAIKGFDNYLDSISRQIFHIDSVQRGRSLEKYIRDSAAQDSSIQLPNFVSNLMETTNLISGKKSAFDRAFESMFGRSFYGAMNWIKNRTAGNMIGGNIGSALTNFIPITQSLAVTNKKSALRGTAAATISYGDPTMIDGMKSSFITRRFPRQQIDVTGFDNVTETANWIFRVIDQFSSRFVVSSRYYDNIDKGMSKIDAMAEADNYAAKVMADRSIGQIPNLFGSKGLGIITQFQTEINNQFSFISKDIPKEAQGSKARILSIIAQLALYSYLFNNLFEHITGRRPALDPIYAGLTLAGLTEEGKDKGAWMRVFKATEDVAGNLPFTGGLTQGRYPISAGIPAIFDILQGKAQWGTELIKPIAFLALPVGGLQIKKSYEGMRAYVQGGTYTPAGNLKYPVERTVDSFIKLLLFGQYATGDAKEYYEQGLGALSETQTKLYKMLIDQGRDREALELYDAAIKMKQANRIISEQMTQAKETGEAPSSEDIKDVQTRLSGILKE